MSHSRLILSLSSVILCVCGLVSSHCDINLVWSIVLRESLTQFVLQVSLPKGLYFKKRTNNTFSSNRHFYWSFPFGEEIYSVLKALQTYHKERLWCLAFFWINHGIKTFPLKGHNQRWNLLFDIFCCRRLKKKNYFCSIICHNRRSHISNTHSQFYLVMLVRTANKRMKV